MTTLGTDYIINTHNLKPKENYSRYPTGIYTMNLLQAGGFNTTYYRSQEGTKETLHKTAFVMATGHSQALDCTENPNNYEILLRAWEHRMARSCLQFKPTTTDGQTDQVHQTDQGQVHPTYTGQVHPTDQNPVCPPDQNPFCNLDQDQEPETQTVTHTQQPETYIPASVPLITGTSPIIQAQAQAQAQTKAKKQAQPPPPQPPIVQPHMIREQHYNHQETQNYQGRD